MARPNKHFAFWFRTFHLEQSYDNVTAENIALFNRIKLLPNHIYIAPTYDIFFHFDSDGSITQGGFEVAIREYDCLNKQYSVTVPCYGSINITYLENFNNSHVFCSNEGIYISVRVEKQCIYQPNWVAVHYDITRLDLVTSSILSTGTSDLKYKRLVVYNNFGIAVGIHQFFDIIDTTDISFFLTLLRIPEPKHAYTLVMNETVTCVFYDLTKIEDNNYLEILNAFQGNKMIDYFFVTDSDYGMLDFYRGKFDQYIAPIGEFHDLEGAIISRRFMPTGYRSSFPSQLIYTEKQKKNHTAFLHARVHNLETESCLFEHNEIDVRMLSEVNGTLTMVNNGTTDCIVTLLNPFREERIYLDSFWTDSAIRPIELHDANGLVLSFTKYSKPDKFVLQGNFYRIIVPERVSFTVVGHDNKLN